jgi:hypothetical protein
VAGFRYPLIVGLGAAMGIQNAAATMLAGALTGALLVRHAPACYPLAIALVTIVLGAVTSHTLGERDPAWVRAPAWNSRPDCRQRKVEERKVEER